MLDNNLFCENCHQRLDPTDKFCRQCGLPTVRQALAQKQTPHLPPDTVELRRNLETQPDPTPFLRAGPGLELGEADNTHTPTTGSVIQATNPTQAFQMASFTIIMIGVIAFMVLAGAAFLILAFR